MSSIKKNYRPVVSKNKEWLPLKGMAFIKRNGFHSKKWLPLKGMASPKKNGFY